jgi:hypothetical protein
MNIRLLPYKLSRSGAGLLFSWDFAAFSSIFFTMSSGTGIAMML